MDAIGRDEHGRAEINYDKCVSCGMVLVNCPFGATVDKGQMFQVSTPSSAATRSSPSSPRPSGVSSATR